MTNIPPKNGPNWSKIFWVLVWVQHTRFSSIMNFQRYLKQNGPPSMKLRFKKTIYKGFTVKAKLAFFALTKKGDFQDQFLIPHSFMSNDGMEMILTGVLVP